MIFASDQWILDKYERFGYWFQKMFGLDCFFLARACCVFGYILIACWAYADKGYLSLVLAVVLGIPPFLVGFLITTKIEQIVKKEAASGFSNFLKTKGNTLRVPWLFIFAVLSFIDIGRARYSFWMSGWETVLISLMYFMSCDPMTPTKSKVRKALEKLRERFSPAPQTAPQES